LLASYGAGVLSIAVGCDRRGNPLVDHATLCGLFFNLDRTETRKANRVRLGILAAFSQRLDKAWFSALVESPDEAEAMFNRQASTTGGAA